MSKRNKSDHTQQCQDCEAARMRRRRGTSLPGDDAVIALGRQCKHESHSGTRHKSTPREATMSAPVAPPDSKPKKPKVPKVSTRKSVDKAPAPPSPDASHRIPSAIGVTFGGGFAYFNVSMLAGPLAGVVTILSGTQAAVLVVSMEVFACMMFTDAIGLTHMFKLISGAGWWRLPITLVSLGAMVALIGLEVGMGDMRDVSHQVGLMTQAIFAGSSEDAAGKAAVADMDKLVQSHAWISAYVQRGFGVVVPVLTMLAVLPLETLLQSFGWGSKPKPAPAPLPAPTPEPATAPAHRERWYHKLSFWPFGGRQARAS